MAIENERTATKFSAAAVSGWARREYERSGDLAATLTQAQQQIDALPLKQAEKITLLNRLQSSLTGASAVRSAQTAELRKEAETEMARLKTGAIDEGRIDDLQKRLRGSKLESAALDLEEQRHVAKVTPLILGGTAEQQVRALHQLQSGGGGGREAYYRAIKGAESGGNPNAKNPDSSATGLYQFTEGTWNALRKEHPELELAPDGRTDPAQQEKAIRVFTDRNEKLLRQVGAEPTAQNLYTAHFLGGAGAQRFLAGLQTDSNALASSYVDKGVAEANRSIFFDDGRARSAQEVYDLLGRKVRGTGGGSQAFADVVKLAQDTVNTRAKETWDAIEKGFEKQQLPSDEELRDIATLIPSVSDAKVRRQIAEGAAVLEELTKRNGLPLDRQQAIASLGQLAAARGDLGAVQRKIESLFQAQVAENARIAKESPLAYAERVYPRDVRPLPPLDISNPDGFRAALTARQYNINLARSREATLPAVALTPTDVEQLKSTYAQATPEEAARMLGDMATVLEPATLTATLGRIVQKDEGATIMAVAGMMARTEPELATSMIRGHKAAQLEKGLSPKDNEAYKLGAQSILPADIVGPRQRAMIQEAAMARYADLARQANDLSGNFDERRYKQAVQDVTGGVLDYAGRKVIAPWRGATEDDLRAAVKSLTAEDLAGAVFAGGQPVSVEEVRRRGKLFSTGDGRYGIFFGSSPDTGWVGRQSPDGRPQVFEIDLRSKRDRVAISALGFGSGYAYAGPMP